MTRLRLTVRIDKRYSFRATYRWARRCGFDRRKALLHALSDDSLVWLRSRRAYYGF